MTAPGVNASSASTPSVTVIVPFRDVVDYLDEALDSLAAQAYPGLQVLLVDDGSERPGAEAIAARQAHQLDIELLRRPPQGVSAARNAGVAAARGEYVAFLDADDVWLPGKLGQQIDALLACPDAVLCYTNSRYVDARGRPLGKSHSEQLGLERLPDGEVGAAALACSFLLPSTLVMRRERYLECGGFDPRLSIGEDWEFLVRCARLGPVLALQQPLILYRRHPQSVGRARDTLAARLSTIDTILAGAGEQGSAGLRRRHRADAYLHAAVTQLRHRRAWRGLRYLSLAALNAPLHLLRALWRARRR